MSQEEGGVFFAECLTEDIFTQGDTLEELKANINNAVKGFYFDRSGCSNIKLRLVKNEFLIIQ
jgi:hypothetical protein